MISVLTSTYNRVEKLNELIYSFLKDTYEDKELIIVNDLPEQELIFDHPQVRIINMPSRFESLGEKRNFLLEMASGEYVTFADDDDIFLPHHLTRFVAAMETHLFINHGAHYLLKVSDLSSIQKRPLMLNGISCWHRHLNLTHDHISVGEDISLLQLAHKQLKLNTLPRLDGKDASYIYKKETMDKQQPNLHLSSFTPAEDIDAYNLFASRAAFDIASGKSPKGAIQLNPNWKYDYERIVREFQGARKPIISFQMSEYQIN